MSAMEEGNPEGLELLRKSLKKVQVTAGEPADSSNVFVVFGASGDLAKKKIYPTLWALFRDNLLPKDTKIFGYARSKFTVEQIREKCVGTVKAKAGEEATLDKFWASNHYVAGSYDTKRDFEMLAQEMGAVEKGRNNRLFYLALPPSVFKPVTTMIKVYIQGSIYLSMIKVCIEGVVIIDYSSLHSLPLYLNLLLL